MLGSRLTPVALALFVGFLGCNPKPTLKTPAQPISSPARQAGAAASGIHEATSSAAHPGISLVRLEPSFGAHVEPAFFSFSLFNQNPDSIRGIRHWPGLFGMIERRGPDDVFRPFPPTGGYCLSASAAYEVPPGQTAEVAELPILGGERVLPPGDYRFVVPHIRESDPERPFVVILPFEVRGLDPVESEELLRLYNRAETRACPDIGNTLLEVIRRSAAPEALPMLFDMDAADFEERVRIDLVIAFFPEHLARLGQVANRNGPGSLAAAVALVEAHARGEPLGMAKLRLFQMLSEKAELPLRAITALSRFSDQWPAEVVTKLASRLSSSRSKDERLALTDILVHAGKDSLGGQTRRVISAIRSAAKQTPDRAAQKAMLEMASELAEEIGDEPARDHPGIGLSAIGESGGSSEDPCRVLFSSLRLHPALRFTPLAWPSGERETLKTTFGLSGVDVYRPSNEE